MRLPTVANASALIVGVYPSAFHVSWWPPAPADPRSEAGRKPPLIRSLAVDVEPVVFWDGATPNPKAELDRWKTESDFDEAVHGRVEAGKNGPTGQGLVEDTLKPLGLDPSCLAYTDALPWYLVKRGKGSQSEAVADRLMPLAERLGIDPGSLPSRPSTSEFVKIASSEPRRASLREEIVRAAAPLVITLGQEALEAVVQVSDHARHVPARLSWERYGQVGELAIGGHQFEFLPLVHPSFRRQTSDPCWRKAFDKFPAR